MARTGSDPCFFSWVSLRKPYYNACCSRYHTTRMWPLSKNREEVSFLRAAVKLPLLFFP